MNSLDMFGQAAVVTGGGRGIGLAIATRILASGGRVALWDIDSGLIEAAREALGGSSDVVAVPVDLTKNDEVARATDATVAAMGEIDILVNNAVLVRAEKPFFEVSDREFLDVYDVNMVGLHRCCRALIPAMMARGYGRVVNLGSTAGKNGTEGMAAYSASKAAIINYTKVIGRELAKTGVIVNCVIPSSTQTEGLSTISAARLAAIVAAVPMGRVALPEEIAALVAWLCTKECSFSTGASFDAAGGRVFY